MAQCIAKSKRSGARCKNWSVRGKAVCRFHGGKSTGPKTEKGKEKIGALHHKHGLRSQAFKRKSQEIRRLIKRSQDFLQKTKA